jgi:hypothetical protein
MTEISFMERLVKNPSYGLIPFFIYSILISYIDPTMAVWIAFALSVLGMVMVKKNNRLLYDISTITFFVALLLSYTSYKELPSMNKFLVVEVTFTFLLILTRLSKGRLLLIAAKESNGSAKAHLKESFRVAFQSQYGLTLHLFLFMLYLVTVGKTDSFVSAMFMKVLFQLVLLLIMVLETTRLYILSKKLFNEDWLPVVTEKGEVTGRVAKSVTKDMKNKFMHPVVRVALMHNGGIYLKERDKRRVLNPGKLDYPFEEYMEFKDELDKAVKESLGKECGNENIPVRFLLKYTFENEVTKRLIFLYVAEIDDDFMFNSLNLQGGKLWTSAQIEDNMGSDIFSECLELEFEYLKNTLLLVQQYKNKLK